MRCQAKNRGVRQKCPQGDCGSCSTHEYLMHFPVQPIPLSLAASWWRKSGHTTAAGLLKFHAQLFNLFIPLTLDRAPLHGTILGGGCLDCWAVQPVMTGLTFEWCLPNPSEVARTSWSFFSFCILGHCLLGVHQHCFRHHSTINYKE